jgi:hypothetical protein
MSNRAKWAHRLQGKQRRDRGRIPAGLAFLALGSFLLLGALRGMRSHVFVFPVIDFRLGSVVMGQTVGLLVVGAAFAIAGLAILFIRS